MIKTFSQKGVFEEEIEPLRRIHGKPYGPHIFVRGEYYHRPSWWRAEWHEQRTTHSDDGRYTFTENVTEPYRGMGIKDVFYDEYSEVYQRELARYANMLELKMERAMLTPNPPMIVKKKTRFYE